MGQAGLVAFDILGGDDDIEVPFECSGGPGEEIPVDVGNDAQASPLGRQLPQGLHRVVEGRPTAGARCKVVAVPFACRNAEGPGDACQ